MSVPKVCIIGAGCSGMVAAKVCHERGIPFDCFERGSGIGGLWRYENDSGTSAAYASLHINTSRKLMEFSDFPMSADYPDFPHHSQILEYFEQYVDHFGFRDAITFRTTVEDVQPTSTGTYLVRVRGDHGVRTEEYASVIVANGHHWKPRYPDFPGKFNGRTLHSHDYRVPDDFRDKRVVVVGFGNSACDIACELSRVARRTFISARRGVHVIPKYVFGQALDRIWPSFLWRITPRWLMQAIFAAGLRIARGRLTKFQLPQPEHGILGEHPTVSSDLLNLVGHGRLCVRSNIAELAGDRVRFSDGCEEEVDAIVFATGYDIAFPFLDRSVLDPTDNEVPLYKRVVLPDRPHLYFVGLVQPWGPIMPLSELQSEWIADLLQGRTSLPDHATMTRDIERDSERMRRRYTRSPRHTIQVDYHPYRAELKRERRRLATGDSVLETATLETATLAEPHARAA